MSTRRRIGVSAATTESARRQLMAKVPCWEKVWITPDIAPAGSTLKVYKWVKTDRTQQFSDDEDEANQPLAPLPDEPEVAEGEGDEDMDQDDLAQPSSLQEVASVASMEVIEVAKENEPEEASKPPSPKPHPLSMSFQPGSPQSDTGDGLEDSLAVGVGVVEEGNAGVDVSSLDMAALGPDGTPFETAHDLTQMEGDDALLSGMILDQSGDPFAEGLVQ